MKIIAAILICIIAFECVAFEFVTGDLLFQTEGQSAMSEAITKSTRHDEISYVHAAIAWVGKNGDVTIVEASPKEGVHCIALDEFLSSSPSIDGKPGVVVMRLKEYLQADEAVERAVGHLGEPYDWYYLPNNGRMYCTELIYEAYLDAEGRHIFQSKPMIFRAPDGSMPEFWTDLFERLGSEIPEGISGTNPNDMARDAQLIEVFRYF